LTLTKIQKDYDAAGKVAQGVPFDSFDYKQRKIKCLIPKILKKMTQSGDKT